MLYFPKILLCQFFTVTQSMTFNKKFFTHRIQYLFFIIFESLLLLLLLLFKSLIVTTAEVYQYHFLINKNKEKTLQWSYNVIASNLQCDSFKLPKQVILTFLGEMNTHLNKP